MIRYSHVFLAVFFCTALFLLFRYGYLAATEGAGSRRARARLIAAVAGASFFIVVPLLRSWYESTLPVFEFEGVIASVRVADLSSKHYSAELVVETTAGGRIAIHTAERSQNWRPGQRLRVRYLGDTGDLLRAVLLDANGNPQGVVNRTDGLNRMLSVLLGAFLCGGAIVRFRRDPGGAVESLDYPDREDSGLRLNP